MEPTSAPGSRKEIVAWVLYDWANSAYSTILITVLMRYLTTVVFHEDDDWGPTAYAFGISASMMVAALLSPVVGALADARRSKSKWLAATALGGAGCSLAMALTPSDWTAAVLGLFVLTSLCFELSLGVYNAFLPEIADERTMNRVSAWGFAAGYLGGAIALILALALVMAGGRVGVSEPAAQLRLGVAIMGVWWGLFSIPTVLVLRDRGRPPAERAPLLAAAASALRAVGGTLKNIRRDRLLALFLLGFLFFNEGVQTVISQASTFATKTPELQFETEELILMILMIQFLALPGSLAVGWLADRLGQKPTLLGCIAVWLVLLVCGFLIQTKAQFWVMGAVVAMIMGGTQSVSRAIMGVMTPARHSGEFFGFFNFSGKATSFLGPMLFGTIFKLTGDTRLAILSLLVFFLLGGLIVSRIDIHEGRRQAIGA